MFLHRSAFIYCCVLVFGIITIAFPDTMIFASSKKNTLRTGDVFDIVVKTKYISETPGFVVYSPYNDVKKGHYQVFVFREPEYVDYFGASYTGGIARVAIEKITSKFVPPPPPDESGDGLEDERSGAEEDVDDNDRNDEGTSDGKGKNSDVTKTYFFLSIEGPSAQYYDHENEAQEVIGQIEAKKDN